MGGNHYLKRGRCIRSGLCSLVLDQVNLAMICGKTSREKYIRRTIIKPKACHDSDIMQYFCGIMNQQGLLKKAVRNAGMSS